MSAPAILWVRQIRAGLVQYELDCRHATTTAAAYTPGTDPSFPLTERQVINLVQARHERTCRCGRRYLRGVPA